MRPRSNSLALHLFAYLAFLLLSFCGATAAQAQQIQVTAATPSSAAQGTVNLNVKVTGKGFKNGASARFFVTATTDTGGVTVNSTTFVSSTELTANITVSDTAALANFDVQVLAADGRGGKGTELFAVVAKSAASAGTCTNLALSPDEGTSPVAASSTFVSPSTVSETCAANPALPGCLDASFGGAGLVATTVSPGNWAVGVVVQPDGKSVVAVRGTNPSGTGSDFYAARYDAAGYLDPSFGGAGAVRLQFTSCADAEHVRAIALLPDGKILLAGYAYIKSSTYGFAVARLNADGSLDTSFGTGGRAFFGFTQSTILQAMALQSDGRIVLAGNAGDNDFSVARLTAGGQLDGTFGSGGKVVVQTAKSGSGGQATAVAVQRVNSEERIVVGGTSPASGSLSRDFAVIRFTPAGALDASFGSGGKVFTDFSGYADRANAVIIAGEGIILGGVAGADSTNTVNHFGLVKYRLNGQLDTTFGVGGKVTTDIPYSANLSVFAMAVQADGKIIAGGESRYTTTGPGDFILARYHPNGSPDVTFGPTGNGQVVTDYALVDRGPNGIVLQADGKILVAGAFCLTNPGSFEYVGLVRYMP